DVSLVDPRTLVHTLHWESDWGSNPAGALQVLGRATSQPLPVIVTSDLAERRAIYVGDVRVPVRVLAAVHAFPFMAVGHPLVITSYGAFASFEDRTKS